MNIFSEYFWLERQLNFIIFFFIFFSFPTLPSPQPQQLLYDQISPKIV